jgi:hypothetical protein
MPTYSKEAMDIELAKLHSIVEGMQSAISRMEFESGTGGVTDRATYHLGEFNDELKRAREQQAEVAMLILAANADK